MIASDRQIEETQFLDLHFPWKSPSLSAQLRFLNMRLVLDLFVSSDHSLQPNISFHCLDVCTAITLRCINRTDLLDSWK